MVALYMKLVFLWFLPNVFGQNTNSTPPNSYPHDYPGQPKLPFGPKWQDYFEVDYTRLPNISFPLSRSFAGNLPVSRPGHCNNTLFFWAFEKVHGSLTVDKSAEPWLIWLNGGPGSSSMIGLVLENGPVRFQDDYTFRQNNYGWDKLVDSVWIDQPVGTGFSTADSSGYVLDSDEAASDFVQFLHNFVEVFPSLKTRPLYLTGESFAGRWIPYITKALFSTPYPPVRLAKIAIGDGVIASPPIFTEACVVTVIETFPQLVGYDTEVLDYFMQQTHLCGYDLNLTYPQDGLLPTVAVPVATNPYSPYTYQLSPNSSVSDHSRFSAKIKQKTLKRYLAEYSDADRLRLRSKRSLTHAEAEREERRTRWKRDLRGRANGSIDSWYACFLQDELYDYVANFTFPWTIAPLDSFNVYEIPDALSPKPPADSGAVLPGNFFNDYRTRSALHAPTTVLGGDTSPDPITFFSELATNASERNVGIIIYSGNWDSLVPHRGSEIAIQNTTFGRVQGFTRKPSTPWYDDDGNFAGIVHQERNFTYALFQGASHLVPQLVPAAAYVFLREFVLGNNKTGLVEILNDKITVIGGENSTLARDFLFGGPDIYYGSYSTQSTFSYPSATVDAWDEFVQSLAQSREPIPTPSFSERSNL